MTLNSGGGTIDTQAYDVATATSFGGTGDLTKDGTGTLTFSGPSSFSGATTIDAGNVTVSGGGVLGTGQIANGASGSITLDGGTVQAMRDEPDYLKGFAPGNIQLASGGGAVDTNGHNIGIPSEIEGPGSLTKTGAGTLNLSAANTYTGPTIIHEGVLQLGAANAIPSDSAVQITGGTFDVNGFSEDLSQALTVTGSGSTLDFGLGHIGEVTVEFADSSAETWTSDLTLTNFTVGTDQLGFGASGASP